MNHYDDLQRFKEKTQTHSLKFKDLSSQAAAGEKGDWTILNQLIPAGEDASLAMGGSVSLPLPQRVPADMFHRIERATVQVPPASSPVAAAIAETQPVPLAASVPPQMHDSALSPERASPAAVSQPASAIRPRPAIAPTADGFAHLFAAKAAEPEPVAKDKDRSLKSLLERIATCR